MQLSTAILPAPAMGLIWRGGLFVNRFIETIEERIASCAGARFVWVVSVFTILSAVNVLLVFGHVFWRDEALPLLIALNNPSLTEFFRAMRYEGTPALWHFLLWCVSKAVPLSPFTAQAIHFVVAECVLMLVLFGLQIPLTYRIIILLQEPFVWNAANVRQYQLAGGLILFFAYCYRLRGKYRFSAMAIALALLAQTCLHGAIVASALFPLLLLDCVASGKRGVRPICLVVIGSLSLAFLQLLPPADLMAGLRTWHLTFSLDRLWFVLNAATGSVFLHYSWITWSFLVLAGAMLIPAFQRTPLKVAVCVCAAVFVFLAFAVIGYAKISGPRHYWLLSYMLIALLIVLHGGTRGIGSRAFKQLFATGLLLMSVWGYVVSVSEETSGLKSQSQNAAEFLDHHFPGKIVLAKSETFECPVRLYRKTHPPEFALGRQSFVKYTVWNHSSVDFVQNPRSEHVALSELRTELLRTDRAVLDSEPIVVLSGFQMTNDLPGANMAAFSIDSRYRLELVEVLEHSRNENYAIYVLRHTGQVERISAN